MGIDLNVIKERYKAGENVRSTNPVFTQPGKKFRIKDKDKDTFEKIKTTPAKEEPASLGKKIKGKIGKLYEDLSAKTQKNTAGETAENSGLLSNIRKNSNELIKTAKKHKGISALIAAGVAVIAGVVIKDEIKKSELKEKHRNQPVYTGMRYNRYF